MLPPHQSKTRRMALESLAPVLNNHDYFSSREHYFISPTLHPQVQHALEEIESQLTPASGERINQIMQRLMLHFNDRQGQESDNICAAYTALLQDFPEDLVCAAYQYFLRNHTQKYLPTVSDFLTFMLPEFNRRKETRYKLLILLHSRVEESVA